MNALDISHKANNQHGAADESHQVGTLLLLQGRLAAAVSAMQDAVKGYQAVGNRSREMIDSLTDLADTLALAGRGDESSKLLDQAQDLARELKNPSVDSSIANAQGDVQFYRGDSKAAKPAYEQALRSATQANDADKILVAKLNLARVAIAEGRAQSAIPDLRSIIQRADTMNLKYLSLTASVTLAQAMVDTKDYSHARQELERGLSRSEKLGLRLETPRIHFLLGDVLRLSGDSSGAVAQYQQTLRLFDDMKKEAGAEHLLDRADLHTMYADANRWVSTLRG
jgi:eukaryotic-like serine/threonine-protein kinase